MIKKRLMMLIVAVMVVSVMACDKKQEVNNTNQSNNNPVLGMISVLDKSKVAMDIQNSDNIRSNFLITLNSIEVVESVKAELQTKKNLCFEVKSVNGAVEITCQNSENMNDLINNVKMYINSLSAPVLRKDLDGSGIIQSQYYVLVSDNNDVRVFVSGAGKTMDNLLNDTGDDGIYQCSPDVCKEYS